MSWKYLNRFFFIPLNLKLVHHKFFVLHWESFFQWISKKKSNSQGTLKSDWQFFLQKCHRKGCNIYIIVYEMMIIFFECNGTVYDFKISHLLFIIFYRYGSSLVCVNKLSFVSLIWLENFPPFLKIRGIANFILNSRLAWLLLSLLGLFCFWFVTLGRTWFA